MPANLPPVDPDVKLPPSVAKQAAAAEALHTQTYQTEPPPVAQPDPAAPQPQPDPQPALNTAPQPAPKPPAPQVQPQPQPQPAPAPDWEHRYHSMEGRYKQAALTIGSMQEQMSEMGDELLRMQRVLPANQVRPQPSTLLTEEDVKTYGPELLDVVKRAAREAVMPDLQNTQSRMDQVNQRVARQTTQGVYSILDQKVPDWRSINQSDRFKIWCGLRDVYSGDIRGKMLNAAFQAADAPRVIAFFTGFLAEEQATGQQPDPLAQPAPQPPRVAATPLETLVAPGRAKPPTGDSPTAVDKPIFTRAQIAGFYDLVRKGSYAGRDADKAKDEAAIFAAQREGRVRG
jgi:hypothetical protein